MAIVTYPLNQIDYTAEDAELYCCTRASGIYAGDDFSCSVTGADNTVTIAPGLAWIRNSRFSGKVAALKSAMALELSLPDSVWPRIDAVVLRFDANSNRTELIVKTGVAASNPAAPQLSRTTAIYELCLFEIYRNPGSTVVTSADVTDRRLSAEHCGLMADAVTRVDTDAISAQLYALIDQLRAEIAGVHDGSAFAPSVSHQIHSYTDPAGFGAAWTDSPEALCAALPAGAVFFASADLLTDAGWSLPFSGGLLSIRKMGHDNLRITLEDPTDRALDQYMSVSGGSPSGHWAPVNLAAGALREKTVWSNPSPAGGLSAQTIDLSDQLEGCDVNYLVVEVRHLASDGGRTANILCRVNHGTAATVAMYSGGKIEHYERLMYARTNGRVLEIKDGLRDGATDDAVCVPVYVRAWFTDAS
ncbi:MAG: hypothetical protein IJD21_02995 [Oscillospiraceae bacterium]|nr:hypothetical protein [Oscillospiraceae bacterium]